VLIYQNPIEDQASFTGGQDFQEASTELGLLNTTQGPLEVAEWGNKYLTRQVHFFKDFVAQVAPKFFRRLPN
jgi:hypothetical protein